MVNISNRTKEPGTHLATEAGIPDERRPTEQCRGASVKTPALMTHRGIVYAVSAMLGALFATVLSRLNGPTADAPLVWVIVVVSFSMLAATLGLGLLAPPTLLIAPCIFVGIGAGVLGNVIYDGLVNRADHDLLPIEIVVMAIVATPGVTAGLGLAWLLRRRHLNDEEQAARFT